MGETAIWMKNISKAFSGVPVLVDVDFELRRGEIHALLGENGAGKTTLMKILTAEFPRDRGQILINGKETHLQNPKEAMDHGIAFVHQELSILETLTVGENIYIGRLPKKANVINWKNVYEKADEILRRLNVDFDARTSADTLSVGQLQMVEIAKAISLNAEIFIMDEPTASLSTDECQRLFTLMRTLAKQDKAFIYISHRLNEVMDISDRITVLRDGKMIDTVDKQNVNPDALSEMIVGRKVEYTGDTGVIAHNKPVALSMKNIVAKNVNDVSMDVHEGEIVSLYGLIGSGRTELLRAVLGIDNRISGTVDVFGKKCTDHYRAILDRGVGYLPEERKTQAVFTGLPVYHNMTIVNLKGIMRKGLLNYKTESKAVKQYIAELNIKANSGDELGNLSGGTQQKVALAKWLFAKSRILLLDEPTKGIDIAARFDIYRILKKLADEGVAILVVTSDLEETMRISDRILIMREGKLVAELNQTNMSEELILSYAINSK